MKPETLKDVMTWNAATGDHRVPDAMLEALVYRSCPECGGSGKCRQCNGRGEFTRYNADGPETRFGEPPPTPQHYEDECDNCRGDGVCPACADAPVPIVDAALREKAIEDVGSYLGDDELEFHPAAIVDAVLSTVLGHVRYAKEPELREAARAVLARWTELDTGDSILDERMDALCKATFPNSEAILEEAGKEE